MLFALGLGDSVVAVTHECDFPADATGKPHLTRTVIPAGLSAREIDAEVKRVTGEGRALYELDEERLAEPPRVFPRAPATLSEVLDDVGRLAETAAVPEAGRELRAGLEARLA